MKIIIRKKGNTRTARAIRHKRIRAKISGTLTRPRLCVFRSLNHIYGQVIDDTSGRTLIAASTLDPELRDKLSTLSKKEQASLVGKLIAQRASEKDISKITFDRAGYRYNGRIKALAEGAREVGLQF